MTKQKRTTQRGNVLFYVLIAVALVAALSIAITNSLRGNTTDVEDNRAGIIAGEILDISNIYATAVAQLRLRGVLEENLCFDDPGWEDFQEDDYYYHAACETTTNRIFHPDGAALVWSRMPRDAFVKSFRPGDEPDYLFHIISDNEIQDVGSTCSEPKCSELLFVIDELSEKVCREINKLLGIEARNDEVPEDNVYGDIRFRGRYNFSETIGDTADSRVLRGRLAGCFESQSQDVFVFYKVLISR
ncbi:MAG: hypothetical protein AAF182_02680 [Pseudomonadota bacterium]